MGGRNIQQRVDGKSNTRLFETKERLATMAVSFTGWGRERCQKVKQMHL